MNRRQAVTILLTGTTLPLLVNAQPLSMISVKQSLLEHLSQTLLPFYTPKVQRQIALALENDSGFDESTEKELQDKLSSAQNKSIGMSHSQISNNLLAKITAEFEEDHIIQCCGWTLSILEAKLIWMLNKS